MATEPQNLQSAITEKGQKPIAMAATDEQSAGAPLVKSPDLHFESSDAALRASAVSRIPVEIDVAVPIRKFRVRNLLSLAKGNVIESQWLQGVDMPLNARGTQLAWAEFEVIEQMLGVRITRLT